MNKSLIVLIVGSLFVSAGCANFNSIHRELDTGKGSGVLIDIKQRAILANKQNDKVRVCSEPSPDAISAYAAELATKANISDRAAGELTAAAQESAAFIGLRTQSIQLLRDSQFRVCEAYMNGAISDFEYGLFTRRHQRELIALLAIEQLTGAVHAPPVTIGAQGSAEASKSLLELRKSLSEIDSEIAEKEKAASTADGAAKERLAQDIKRLKEDRELIEKSIGNARGILASGTTFQGVATVSVVNNISDGKIDAIAKVVGDISKSFSETDDLAPICFGYVVEGRLTQQQAGNSSDLASSYIDEIDEKGNRRRIPPLAHICRKYLEDIAQKNIDEGYSRMNSSSSSATGSRQGAIDKKGGGGEEGTRREPVESRNLFSF